MDDVIVTEIRSRRDRRAFVDLPWSLYREDPNWICPLRRNQEQLLGYRHHAFHDNAEVQTFLAHRDGQVCGRVAAIVNHAHNQFYNERRGFFGYFESIDDPAVTAALFDRLREWFAARQIRAIRGPTNPSMNYECGLLIDGFDSPPVFMMTYNPPYYPRLIEEYGFAKAQDLYAYYGHVDQLPTVLAGKPSNLAEMALERSGATIRMLNKKRFREDVDMFVRLYNRSLEGTWGFVPLPEGEIRHLATSLRHLLVPELAVAAEVDGKPVGAVVVLLDYNPRIKRIDGRLFPFGAIKLLTNRQEIRRVRVISINVLPEFQNFGLGLALLKELVPSSLAWGAQEAEFSWVLESNMMARAGLEKGSATIYKRYRIYDLEPEAAANP